MPYAPAVNDQGAEFLFRGISQAGNGLARGFEQMMAMKEKQEEENKRLLQNGKLAKQTFKINPEMLPKDMSMDQVEALSAQDAADLLQGTITAQGLKRYQQQSAQAEREAVTAEALKQFARDAADPGPPVPDAPAGMLDELGGGGQPAGPAPAQSPDIRILQALRNHPEAAASPQFDNLMAGLRQFMPNPGAEPFSFDPSRDVVPLPQVPGNYFVKTSKGGGQLTQDVKAIEEAARAKETAKGGLDPRLKEKIGNVRAKLKAVYAGLGDGLTPEPRIAQLESQAAKLEKELDALLTSSQSTPTQANPEAQALIAEANAAIKAGAPRDKVLARLREKGIQVK